MGRWARANGGTLALERRAQVTPAGGLGATLMPRLAPEVGCCGLGIPGTGEQRSHDGQENG